MRPFRYRRARSLDDLGVEPESAFLAGGQSLLPEMKARQVAPAVVIDVKGVLPVGIRIEDGRLVVGAGATHASIAASAVVRCAIPVLADIAAHVGDPAVRHRGTLGGALVSDHPAGDWPAIALVLDAELRTTARRVRFAAARGGLGPGELLLEVAFTTPDDAASAKFLHPAARYAAVGVSLARFGATRRVSVTGLMADGAALWPEAENPGDTEPRPPTGTRRTDTFAGGDWRASTAGELLARAVALLGSDLPRTLVLIHGRPQLERTRPARPAERATG